MLKIEKRGAKFFLIDEETGEQAGSEKGYPTRQAAAKARETLESAAKLPKSPMMPSAGLGMPRNDAEMMPLNPMMGGKMAETFKKPVM